MYEATWSPRGDGIAFIGRAGLIVTRPDGSGRRLLDPHGAGGIAWSPDGSHIASEDGGPAEPSEPLVLVSLQGPSRIRKIALDAILEDPSQPIASWSPDGRRFLYTTGARLCSVAADTPPAAGRTRRAHPRQRPYCRQDLRRSLDVASRQPRGRQRPPPRMGSCGGRSRRCL